METETNIIYGHEHLKMNYHLVIKQVRYVKKKYFHDL